MFEVFCGALYHLRSLCAASTTNTEDAEAPARDFRMMLADD